MGNAKRVVAILQPTIDGHNTNKFCVKCNTMSNVFFYKYLFRE